MILEYLRVDGLGSFKGVEIDFSQIPPGLVAVAGKNGEGKTFFLETIPAVLYRKMPSRSGVFSNHGDAQIDMELIFRYNGHRYRAHQKAGGRDAGAYLYEDGVSLTSGKVPDYPALLARKFVSPEIFLASAFASQKKRKLFEDMQNRDRKALFIELLGHTRLQQVSALAGKRVIALEKERDQLSTALAQCRATQDQLVGLRQTLGQILLEIENSKLPAQAVREQVAQHETEINSLNVTIAVLEVSAQRLPEVERQQAEVAQQIAVLDRDLETLDAVLRTAMQDDLRRTELAVAKAEVVRAEKEVADAENVITSATLDVTEQAAAQTEVQTLLAQVAQNRAAAENIRREERQKLETDLGACNLKLTEAQHQTAASRSEHDQANRAIVQAEGRVGDRADVPCGDTFPSCKYIKDAVALRGQLPDLHRDLVQATDALESAQAEQQRLEQQRGHAVGVLDAHKTLPPPTYDTLEAQLAPLRARLDPQASSRLQASQQGLVLARTHRDMAVRKVAALEATLADAPDVSATQKRMAELKAMRAPLEHQHDVALEGQIVSLRETVRQFADKILERNVAYAALTGLAPTLKAIEEVVTANQARSQSLAGQIAALEDQVVAQPSWEAQYQTLLDQLAVEDHLRHAFGPYAIQGMQIAAVGPTVSGIANDLLQHTYGPRFEVELQTLRQTQDGKEVDDFDVIVTDHVKNRKGSIDTFSGGESVILNEDFALAVAMFNCRRRSAIQTIVRDETGGFLDPEHLHAYMQMLRRAHDKGGFHHLLFVAHDASAQDYANSRILVKNGKVTVQA